MKKFIENDQCIAIATIAHGKWTYKTVVIYTASKNSKGMLVWKKGDVLDQATTEKKIARLALEYCAALNLPLVRYARHGHSCNTSD